MSTALIPTASTDLTPADQGWDVAEQIATAFLLGYKGNTSASYRRDLTDWFTFCATLSVPPLAATRAYVDGYCRHLAENEHRSPATIARRLSTLAGFYRYAVDEEVITRNPVGSVRRPKVGDESQSTGLDKDELAALMAGARSLGPRPFALVLLLSLNGLRISEALAADVEHLATERGHRVLHIVRKGGKRATVPLAPRTAEAVDQLVAGRTSGPLFATKTGGRLNRSEAWRLLRRIAETAVPDKATTLHPHDLRHAFVTLSLDAGATLHDVQDAAGHADPRTTQRYNRARHNLDRHPTYALAGLVPVT